MSLDYEKMRRMLLILSAVGCAGSQSRPTTAAAPTEAQPSVGAIPSDVGRFHITSTEAVKDLPNDSAYRFTDGSTARVTVFRYLIPPDVQIGPDSEAWAAHEAGKFVEVQPILVRQGRIDNYEVVFVDSAAFAAGKRILVERRILVVTRSRGRVNVDFQYLYLVNGRFLKVRATIPSDGGWENSGVPGFARALAERLATGRG